MTRPYSLPDFYRSVAQAREWPYRSRVHGGRMVRRRGQPERNTKIRELRSALRRMIDDQRITKYSSLWNAIWGKR